MTDLTEYEKYKYDNAKYCHICKKVFGEAKSIEKYVIMIITQVNLGVLPFNLQFEVFYTKRYPCVLS